MADLAQLSGTRGAQHEYPASRRVAVRGERFGYEYDFGSTTPLQLRVMSERTGRLGYLRRALRGAPDMALSTAPYGASEGSLGSSAFTF